MMIQMAACNTIIQTIVDDSKRGRVMSFYMMAFIGLAPFGSLLAGTLASRLGAPNTLIMGGVLCVLVAVIFASKLPDLKKNIRPLYVKLGILSESPLEIQAAAELTIPPEKYKVI